MVTSGANSQVDLGIRSERVEPGAHIALLWETDAEFEEAVGFLERGAHEGDHLVVFGHDEGNQRVIEVLRRRGVDVDALSAEGRLDVLGGAETGEATLAGIGASFTAAVDRGAELIRLLGNIGWGREGWPSESDLLRFESQVTEAAKAFPCVIVCMYDLRSCSGASLVHGCFQTHPLTFLGNLVRENPHYVPHAEFTRRLEANKSREKPDSP